MLDSQTPTRHCDILLTILKEHGHPYLPKTYRTLMGTNTNIKTTQYSENTELYYYSVSEVLKSNLLRYPREQISSLTEVQLQLHFDGLPLYRSSTQTLWPLLVSFWNITPSIVFPLNLAMCANGKPDDTEYLSRTVDELNDVINNGIVVHGVNIPVSIVMVVADAPARSMIKKIKGHSGYHGCGRCKQRGVWVDNRVVYLEFENLLPRTDEEFRNRIDVHHHHPVASHGTSPLLPLPIDMIMSFSIDYMHNVCLGK